MLLGCRSDGRHEARDLAGLDGAAEQVPLSDPAAHDSQKIELSGRFDPFGDDSDRQAVRKIDHCGDDRRDLGIFGHLLDERHVELDDVDREIAQVCQRRAASSKVVERHGRARCLENIQRAGDIFRAAAEERQAIWRARLLGLGLFRLVHDALHHQPGAPVDRDFVLETLALHMPQENPQTVFSTFIRWARFGNLFAYDEARQAISLQ